MIGQLKGNIDSVTENYCIIDTGGVGYIVFCSSRTLSSLSSGEAVKLSIETHVREDHIHLYGFNNEEEKSAFNTLQSVKGVGTRMALAILSTLSPNEIQSALTLKNSTAFHAVSGVGKKLAERIITELKDKIISSAPVDISIASQKGAAATATVGAANDAITALMQLGIGRQEAQNRVSQILASNPEEEVGEVIRLALKN